MDSGAFDPRLGPVASGKCGRVTCAPTPIREAHLTATWTVTVQECLNFDGYGYIGSVPGGVSISFARKLEKAMAMAMTISGGAWGVEGEVVDCLM